MRKEFMDRCVSPSYHNSSRHQLNGEINLINLKHIGGGSPGKDGVYMNTRSKKKAAKAAA